MAESEQTIRRYLLGQLSESEQSALEEKYFSDPPVFNQVLKIESELLDLYVRGRLANDERERFERSYMAHPPRKERVEFAAALAARLDQIHETATFDTTHTSWWNKFVATLTGRNPTLKVGLAFALLLVILSGAWLLINNSRRQSELAQSRAAQEAEQQRQREQSAKNPNDESAGVVPTPQPVVQPTPNPPEDAGPRTVSLALTVGGVRGGNNNSVPTLVISPGTTQARLLLSLTENNYQNYQAFLKTIEGKEILSQRNIKPVRARTAASFVFTLPVSKLANGDYVLTLQGVNTNGEVDDLSKSLFRVEKK